MKTLRSVFTLAALLLLTITIRGQEIFDAIKNNDLPKIKSLIERDASLINIKDASGNIPLHIAAIKGSVAVTELLIKNGAEIDAANNILRTPLFESITNGKDEVSKLLIEKGAGVNTKDKNYNTPLHLAAQYNRTAVAELLLAGGADIESRDRNQYTPFNFGTRCQTSGVEILELLMKKGADINAKDNAGNNAFMNAAMYNSDEIINFLLDHQAVIDTSGLSLKYLLSVSSVRSHLRLFNYVLEKGGSSLLSDEAYNLRIMRNALMAGSVDIVKILQSKNIPMDFSANLEGLTPLHFIASDSGKLSMIEFFVRNGADINARTNDGRSAYNIAETSGNTKALDIILRLGGNPEPQKFPVLTGPYMGQIPPGDEAKVFAPGIVTIDHCTFTASPDGNEMYWGTGTIIMFSKVENGRWTKPAVAPFSGKGSLPFYDDCPFLTPDNKKLFFVSRRPYKSEEGLPLAHIWYMDRTKSGWSEPKPVSEAVNSMKHHWQISVSASGTLYFASFGEEGNGADIYCSSLVKGEYAKPVNIGPVINSKESEMMPFISPDESYILFFRVINQRGVIFISFKGKEGQWMQPEKIEQITPHACAIVSYDKKYLFFDRRWISAKFIEDMRPMEK